MNNNHARKKARGAIRKDLAVILAGCVAVYAISWHYDLLEWFYRYSRSHDSWELDEFATVAVFLVLALAVFSLRRLGEVAASRKEIKIKNRELQAALEEVKELRGLLPICASCKSIRDDKGFWHQVESYISAHSGASFTHGICPQCMRELYPEYCEGEDAVIPPEHLHLGEGGIWEPKADGRDKPDQG